MERSDRGNQDEPGQDRARDRAERVGRVDGPDRGPRLTATALIDRRREREKGAEKKRGQEHDPRGHTRLAGEEVGSAPARLSDEGRLHVGERVEYARAEDDRPREQELKQAEEEHRRARPLEKERRERRAERDPKEIDREDRGEGIDHAPERHRQDSRPRDLVEERAEAGDREKRDDQLRKQAGGSGERRHPRHRVPGPLRARAARRRGALRGDLAQGSRGTAGLDSENRPGDGEIQDPRRGRGLPEPQRRDQREPGGRDAEDRTHGVDRVEARDRRAELRLATGERRDQKWKGGAHRDRGNQERHEEDQEAHEQECGSASSHRPVQAREKRPRRVIGQRARQPHDSNEQLEPRVEHQGFARA